MAGTGRFLLAAVAKGFRTVAVELEEKFVGFLKDNREYASKKLWREIDMTIVKGDARHLSDLLAERGLVSVTSPPYGEAISRQGGRQSGHPSSKDIESGMADRDLPYSTNPDNIGNLKDKPLTIVSPPYISGGHHNDIMQAGGGQAQGKLSQYKEGYGSSEGQIGALPDRPLRAVTRPPYEDALESGSRHTKGGIPGRDAKLGNLGKYGVASEGQIGQERSQNYLEAMAQVYAEIAKVSDVLVIVLKNPTRNGKLRRLDLDTIAILEAQGWKILCRHEAVLFEEQEQGHLLEGSVKKPKGRLSFFKRLQYQRGGPVASHEDVIFCVRGLRQ
jgi:hypothetical protein